MQEPSTRTLAKTTRPFLASSVIPRPRLFTRLDDALSGPAVWLQGMPGAGKTSLLGSYVQSRGIDALWYQLDPGDADPASFTSNLWHAAARRFAQAIPPPGTDAGEASVRQLFRSLYRGFEGPFLLVIDNCNDAPVTSRVHGVLAMAVEEMPPSGTVVFVARHAPSAALARLRACGSLTLIGPEELVLDAQEARAIAGARDVELADEVLDGLCAAAGGWAAGLVLMLEHVRAGGEVTRTPTGLAPQVIFDYLACEVFERFDATVQRTLCAVAFLQRVTGPLAAAISGQPGAEDVLHNMARNSYFVSRVDDDSTTWFEFHPLFGRFLEKQAGHRCDARERATWRGAAARWLEDNGYPDEALRVLARAGDWVALERALARHGSRLLTMPDVRDLRPALAALPESESRGKPWLLHWRAHVELDDDPRGARRMFAEAHDAFGDDPEGRTLCAWGALRAVLAEFDDLALADPWIERLRATLDGDHDLPPVVHAAARRTLGTVMLLRGRAARDDDPADGDANGPLDVLLDCLRGDFASAAARLPAAEQGPPDAAMELVAGLYFLLRGEPGACREAVDRCLGAPATDLQRLLASALEVACDRIAGDGVADLADAGPRRLHAALEGYLEGWRLSLSGDPLDAFHRTREGASAASDLGLTMLESACQAALAQRAAACGDLDAASLALARSAENADQRLTVVEFARQLAASGVALDGDDPAVATSTLASALRTGRAHGLRVSLGYRPEDVARLCARALEEGIEPEYARSLLRAHDLTAHAPPAAASRWPWPIRIHGLGGLRVERHDQPLRLSGKGESRLVELLKLLLAHGGRDVPQDRLAALLWPHVDGDYAYRSFTTTVYRLRKLLDVADAVIVQDGNISLNPACCWADTWELERTLERVESSFWDTPGGVAEERALALTRTLERHSPGAFLGDADEHPASLALRARLRRRLQRALVRLAGWWEGRGEHDRAVDVLQRALDADPAAEGLYREMMLLLERIGRGPEALEVYRVCRAALDAAGHREPEAATQQIAQRLERGSTAAHPE